MKLKGSRLTYFSKQNVGTQLRSLYIVAIILPILVIGSIVYIFSYHQQMQNYEHLTAMKARQVQSILVATTLYTENIYNSVVNDENLRTILSTDYKDTAEAQKALNHYEGFTEILSKNATLSGLKLYIQLFLSDHGFY